MKTELTCEILERNKLDYQQESVRIRVYFDYFKDKWMIYALSFLGYARTVQDMNKLLKRNNIDKEIKA